MPRGRLRLRRRHAHRLQIRGAFNWSVSRHLSHSRRSHRGIVGNLAYLSGVCRGGPPCARNNLFLSCSPTVVERFEGSPEGESSFVPMDRLGRVLRLKANESSPNQTRRDSTFSGQAETRWTIERRSRMRTRMVGFGQFIHQLVSLSASRFGASAREGQIRTDCTRAVTWIDDPGQQAIRFRCREIGQRYASTGSTPSEPR